MHVERRGGLLRFGWLKAQTSAEIARLTTTLAQRIGRYLDRQNSLERVTEKSQIIRGVLLGR